MRRAAKLCEEAMKFALPGRRRWRQKPGDRYLLLCAVIPSPLPMHARPVIWSRAVVIVHSFEIFRRACVRACRFFTFGALFFFTLLYHVFAIIQYLGSFYFTL
jgi:hypothetical protein